MSKLDEASGRDRVDTVYLVEIGLVGVSAPLLCMAERDILVDGTMYEGYLLGVEGLEWGTRRLAQGDDGEKPRLRILNEPWRGYSRLLESGEDFPFEGATLYIKEVYMDADREPTGSDLLYQGVIEGASAADLMGFTLK